MVQAAQYGIKKIVLLVTMATLVEARKEHLKWVAKTYRVEEQQIQIRVISADAERLTAYPVPSDTLFLADGTVSSVSPQLARELAQWWDKVPDRRFPLYAKGRYRL